MFKHFQKIGIFYWKHFHVGWFISLLIMVGFVQYTLKIHLGGNGLEVITTVLGAIITIFGFGIALIGSLNISYSLTKILVKYQYLQMLSICILLVVLRYFLPYSEDLLNFVSLASLVGLYIHTFALIDKMYDPEDIIVDVIVPMIINFENENIKIGHKVNLYGYFRKDKIQPIGFNEIIIYTSLHNAELDSFGKAILRLAKDRNLKLFYFFAYLEDKINNRQNWNNQLNLLDDKVDADSLRIFLINCTIYQIITLSKDGKHYDDILSQLLLYITSTLLSVRRNPENKYGSLSSDEMSSLINQLDNKVPLLSIIQSVIEHDEEERLSDKDEQILQLTIRLLVKYIETNASTNEVSKDCYILAGMSNEVIDKIKAKKPPAVRNGFIEIFFYHYAELIYFLKKLEKKRIKLTTDNKYQNVINNYYENIFSKYWKEAGPRIQQKLKDKAMSLIYNQDYFEKYKRALKELRLSGQAESNLRSLDPLINPATPPSPPPL